ETDFSATPPGMLAIARARHGAGMLAFYQGDYRQAVHNYELSLGLFRRLENKTGMANVLNALAQLTRMRGHFPQILGFNQEAIALFEELQNPTGVFSTGVNYSIGLWQEGSYSEARKLAIHSLSGASRQNHPFGIAGGHLDLGWIDLADGELDKALAHFQ